MNSNVCNDTFLLIHDTLYSNGFPRNHPILQQSVRCFHVDALTHFCSAKCRQSHGDKEFDDAGPKNQWFLVIEGQTLQAYLSMQLCENIRTGGVGVLTLQIMNHYPLPPSDVLHRQTYHCHRKNLTVKAVLETIFFNGWHKYEIAPLESGFLRGRRHHMMTMLFDLQHTSWIEPPRSLQGPDTFDYLKREYIWDKWLSDNRMHVLSREFPILPGRFRLDVGRLPISQEPIEWPVTTRTLLTL